MKVKYPILSVKGMLMPNLRKYLKGLKKNNIRNFKKSNKGNNDKRIQKEKEIQPV